MLSGIGDTYARTTTLGSSYKDQRMLLLKLFNFNYVSDSTPREAKGYVQGIKRTVASAENEVNETLTLSTQFVDWAQLGFALDKFSSNIDNFLLPTIKVGTVAQGTTYGEIADAAVTDANDEYILSYVNAFGTWGQPGFLGRAASAGAPAAGEFDTDTTNNLLLTDAGLVGASVSYLIPTAYNGISVYGGRSDQTGYGKIAFRGKLFTTEGNNDWGIYFPQLSRKSRPTIDLSADVPELSIDFTPEIPAGWDEPYVIYNLDTGTVVSDISSITPVFG